MSCGTPSLSNLGPKLIWEIKQGASFSFEAELRLEGDSHTVVDENGNTIAVGPPIDLTGCTIRCQIRKRGNDTGTPVVTPTVTIVDAVNGVYRITLTDEQTATIACGERIRDQASIYTADILCEFPSGDVMELGNVSIYTLRRVTK